MKTLATAVVVLLFTLGAGLEARDLPKPISAVERQKTFTPTHSVRDPSQKLPGPIRLDSYDRHREVRQTHAVRVR